MPYEAKMKSEAFEAGNVSKCVKVMIAEQGRPLFTALSAWISGPAARWPWISRLYSGSITVTVGLR